MSESMIEAKDLTKNYHIGEIQVEVLKNINLTIPKAQFTVFYGPSGAGKTTFLNIISGIDRPTSGKIIVAQQDLTEKDENSLSNFRCHQIGFVFQAYNLVSTLTVAENVAFPMEWTRKPTAEIEKRVKELLQMVGLESRSNHFPSQLSGGEQQRVAFARALANNPPVILADEPTGNLDANNAEKIMQVLQLLKSEGKTVIVSSHDLQIRRLADKALLFENGHLASQNE
jgi:putative ABC transport system ATP-binding protein